MGISFNTRSGEELKRILESDPQDTQAHLWLGRYYREHNEPELSVNEFELALKGVCEKDLCLRNILLNEIELSLKKTVLESKPQRLLVMLSNKCNINCLMCEVVGKRWELPLERVKEICGFFPYIESIQWQGGEVFALDYFEELFDEASRYPGLNQSISTNGLLLNEKWAEKLARNRVMLVFSVDGATKEVYERIRRGSRFEDMLKNIGIFNEANRKQGGIAARMNSVIMRSNYEQLDMLLDFAVRNKFGSLVLSRIHGNIDGPENIFYHEDKTAEDFIKKTLPGLAKKADEGKIELMNHLYPIEDFCELKGADEGKDRVEQAARATPGKIKGFKCYSPWRQMAIDVNGIRPECRCSIPAGSANENSLAESWNNTVMRSYRERLLTGQYSGFCSSECFLERYPNDY